MTLLQISAGASPPSAPRQSARPTTLSGQVAYVAAQQGIDPALLAALVTQESGGNPAAHSGDGGIGLTQLTTQSYVDRAAALAKQLTGSANPYDPISNLTVGAQVLRDGLGAYGFNFSNAAAPGNSTAMRYALDAYNAGQGAVNSALARGVNPDAVTTNGNYGSNVLALYASYLKAGLFGSTTPTGFAGTATAPPYQQPTGGGNQADIPLPFGLPSIPTPGLPSIPTPGLPSFSLPDVFTGITDILSNAGKTIGRWLLLAIIGIVILLVLDQLVTGAGRAPSVP